MSALHQIAVKDKSVRKFGFARL